MKCSTTPSVAERAPSRNDAAPSTPLAMFCGIRMGACGLYTAIAYAISSAPTISPPTAIAGSTVRAGGDDENAVLETGICAPA